jgi:HlyD family secretion protein
MKRTVFRWLFVLLALGVIAGSVYYFTRPKPLPVSVQAVAKGKVERTVANTRAGTVEACRRAKLSPSIGGQITALPIHEGDRVEQGQLLLELFNDDLQAELALVGKQIEAARAQATAACVNSDKADREAKRIVELARKGAASEDDMDSAVTGAKAAAAQCLAARTEITSRQAQREVTLAQLERTRLVAPFSGTIAEINGELSEFVTPSPIGIATPPAVDLIDTGCFYVSAPIDEVDAAPIVVGMAARISLDAFADNTFTGKVRRIADYVLDREKQARTVDVEVAFSNAEELHKLLAGYSADVEILIEVHDNVLRLPSDAIMEGNEVFIFDPVAGVVHKKQLTIGLANWDFSEIVSGLSAGELVVIGGDRTQLKDGSLATRTEEKK